jgi:hypothetical protein
MSMLCLLSLLPSPCPEIPHHPNTITHTAPQHHHPHITQTPSPQRSPKRPHLIHHPTTLTSSIARELLDRAYNRPRRGALQQGSVAAAGARDPEAAAAAVQKADRWGQGGRMVHNASGVTPAEAVQVAGLVLVW